MSKPFQLRIWTCLFLALVVTATASAQTKLLRFPDLHGDRIVFTYGGDLWSAPVAGGTASRLTAHPGEELFAKFSPDGKSLAFTGQYDGDEQVYVMPSTGGVPEQLTFYPASGPLPPRWGYDHHVFGWTPDGGHILFRSLRDSWEIGRLFTVSKNGGFPDALPMPAAGSGAFAGATKVVYSPLFRDFRHWKRYEGGWAQDLYLFDIETHESQQITDHPRSDRDPMWIDGKVYFSSDRDDFLNLYVYDPATGETEALTDYRDRDVRWPSADEAGKRIIYELDGELMIFDLASKQSRPVTINVPTDGVAKRASRVNVSDQIQDVDLGPKGKRAVFEARGDLYSVPLEHGPIRALTRSPGAHDRSPSWSPDGKTIAYVSDQDGEDAIYLLSAGPESSDKPRRLVGVQELGLSHLSGLAWSADSEHLAFRDQGSRLYVASTASGEWQMIIDDPGLFSLDYEWSPRGHFLAYAVTEENRTTSVFIWDQAEKRSHRATNAIFNEMAPTWDPKGDYLFFMSQREFAPQIGSFEFNYAVDRATSFFALALRQDVPHPLPPRSDEVEIESDDEDEGDEAEVEKAKKGKKEKKAKADEESSSDEETLRIDFDGLSERIVRLPIEADNYFGLVAVEGGLVFVRGFPFYYGRGAAQSTDLRFYSFEDREEKSLAENVGGWAVSADGTKLLYVQNGQYVVISPQGGDKKTMPTSRMAMDLVPAEEWEQIFHAVWRRFRDYFYVDNMHGYDWEALREKYAALLPHVAHRSDLNYLMSEMIAELNVSHAYVSGGDVVGLPPRPRAGLLGVRFELDKDAGRFRLADILEGHNEEPRYRSPLTEVGVDVDEGDYVLAINGVPLAADDNPYRVLRHAGGSLIELTVNAKPEAEGARRVMVRPLESEDALYYLDWIEEMRRRVDEATDGRVGYIHIPDMGSDGIYEFIKWFYPQLNKEGLIIDVRSNGGGNVSGMIMERLSRELLMVDYQRNLEFPNTYPTTIFNGHLVCLLDEDTASDGDQFAYAFKTAGLGPLIGKRSWGGVVGIYGREPLIDGGGVSVPEVGTASAQGEWVIEGRGVDPDIVVENDPKELLAGRDQQLERGIQEILKQIENDPKSLPERPAPPDKTPRSR